MQGEVLAGLQQKLKYSERERTFCCLVAEGAEQPDALAGVVEVSLQGEPVRAPCPAPVREDALRSAGVVEQPCVDTVSRRTCWGFTPAKRWG